MVEISFFQAQFALAAVWLAVRALICLSTGKVDLKREAKLLILYFNFAVVLRYTFFPLYLNSDGSIPPLIYNEGILDSPWINLEPFSHLDDFVFENEKMLNIWGNIALFVPTGIILPMLFKKMRIFPLTVLMGAFISFCIEVVQLLFDQRVSDVDDIILNTTGTFIGYIIYFIIYIVIKLAAPKQVAKG